jgi:hypothetical protein
MKIRPSDVGRWQERVRTIETCSRCSPTVFGESPGRPRPAERPPRSTKAPNTSSISRTRRPTPPRGEWRGPLSVILGQPQWTRPYNHLILLGHDDRPVGHYRQDKKTTQARALRVPHVRNTCGSFTAVMADRNLLKRLSHRSQVVTKLSIKHTCPRRASAPGWVRTGPEGGGSPGRGYPVASTPEA